MVRLNAELERINQDAFVMDGKDAAQYKLFNALPLRREIIPKYITLDTAALISLFNINHAQYITRTADPAVRKEVWSKFFKLDSKYFKRNGYAFDHLLKTNGVACSAVFIKTDEEGVPLLVPRKHNNDIIQVKYIDDVKITYSMKTKRIVTIDPGKHDLITAMKDGSKNEPVKYFRYTQRERQHFTKKKKYNQIRWELKDNVKINGKTITELEKELLKFNSKTSSFKFFKNYLRAKIRLNRLVFNHYSQTIYRKLTWNTKINLERNEDMMLNRFEKEMGSPDEIMVILGDYSDTGLKGTEPSITKKIRKLLIKRGYEVYLIDEFNTSKKCSCCQANTENLPRANTHLSKKCKCDKETENHLLDDAKKPNKCDYCKKASKTIWKLKRCQTCPKDS